MLTLDTAGAATGEHTAAAATGEHTAGAATGEHTAGAATDEDESVPQAIIPTILLSTTFSAQDVLDIEEHMRGCKKMLKEGLKKGAEGIWEAALQCVTMAMADTRLNRFIHAKANIDNFFKFVDAYKACDPPPTNERCAALQVESYIYCMKVNQIDNNRTILYTQNTAWATSLSSTDTGIEHRTQTRALVANLILEQLECEKLGKWHRSMRIDWQCIKLVLGFRIPTPADDDAEVNIQLIADLVKHVIKNMNEHPEECPSDFPITLASLAHIESYCANFSTTHTHSGDIYLFLFCPWCGI